MVIMSHLRQKGVPKKIVRDLCDMRNVKLSSRFLEKANSGINGYMMKSFRQP